MNEQSVTFVNDLMKEYPELDRSLLERWVESCKIGNNEHWFDALPDNCAFKNVDRNKPMGLVCKCKRCSIICMS